MVQREALYFQITMKKEIEGIYHSICQLEGACEDLDKQIARIDLAVTFVAGIIGWIVIICIAMGVWELSTLVPTIPMK
jgi:hypothetical protein